MLLISLTVLIVIILFLWMTFIVVPHQNVYIIERLGQFNKALDAGFHFLIPIIDKVAYKHTLK
jgi:regulator of protease activity HflC (stomatin/prohibitin superfamily)